MARADYLALGAATIMAANLAINTSIADRLKITAPLCILWITATAAYMAR